MPLCGKLRQTVDGVVSWTETGAVNCLPLRHPRQWPDLQRRSLLVGFPIIGPQAGAYADICRQLSLRAPECWSLWGPNAARVEAARFVAKVVGEAVEWPNPILIPDDPYELVFWDHKSCTVDDFSLVGAFLEIEKHFGKSSSEEEATRIYEGTLGCYVDFLTGTQ